MSATSEYVELSSGRFHYLDWGGDASAPVAILLHGFNQTAHSWDEVAPLLRDEHRIVAIDQRGHGQTEWARDKNYSRQAMVDDVRAIADHVGADRFAVIGMSMGAVHATLLAGQAGDRVSSLVTVDWAPHVETAGIEKIKLIALRTWDSFDTAVREVMMFNQRRTEENVRERLSHSLREREDGQWTWKVDLMGFASDPRFSDGSETMWQHVSNVRCPALVVRGGDSDVLSEHAAAELEAKLSSGRGVTVPDAGHSVAGDNPGALHAAIAPFLREHR